MISFTVKGLDGSRVLRTLEKTRSTAINGNPSPGLRPSDLKNFRGKTLMTRACCRRLRRRRPGGVNPEMLGGQAQLADFPGPAGAPPGADRPSFTTASIARSRPRTCRSGSRNLLELHRATLTTQSGTKARPSPGRARLVTPRRSLAGDTARCAALRQPRQAWRNRVEERVPRHPAGPASARSTRTPNASSARRAKPPRRQSHALAANRLAAAKETFASALVAVNPDLAARPLRAEFWRRAVRADVSVPALVSPCSLL